MAINKSLSHAAPDAVYLIRGAHKHSHSWCEVNASVPKELEWAIARGRYAGPLPISIKLIKRKKLLPFAWTTYFPVVTQAVLDLLTARQVSGWVAYPVALERSSGMEPRFALGITGRCERITFDREPKNLFPKIWCGKLALFARLLVDMTQWDGSDLFMAKDEKTLLQCSTQKVMQAFSDIKEPGITFEPVEEASLFVTSAQTNLQD